MRKIREILTYRYTHGLSLEKTTLAVRKSKGCVYSTCTHFDIYNPLYSAGKFKWRFQSTELGKMTGEMVQRLVKQFFCHFRTSNLVGMGKAVSARRLGIADGCKGSSVATKCIADIIEADSMCKMRKSSKPHGSMEKMFGSSYMILDAFRHTQTGADLQDFYYFDCVFPETL